MKENDPPIQCMGRASTKKRRDTTKHNLLGWANRVNADRDDSSPKPHQPDNTNGFRDSHDISSSTVRENGTAPRWASLADSLASLEPPPLPCKTEKEILQRLAVDIPADLHAKIKEMASRPGASVREDITALLAWFYKVQ